MKEGINMNNIDNRMKVQDAFPELLFEALEEYNRYIQNHSNEEADKYIKEWMNKRVKEKINLNGNLNHIKS